MIQQSGLWHYLEKWRPLASGCPAPVWQNGRLDNASCGQCRFCCGKQDNAEPFPMALLPEQLGPDNQDDFYMLDAHTAGLGAEGCKSASSSGCRLPVAKRPVACGLFPIVLVNGRLYLYQICPAVMFAPLDVFYRLAREVGDYLERFSIEDLRRISITLSDKILMDRYINLHIQIFDRDGKNMVFD